ncbi:DUF3558 family protein [Actinopolyspora alba]|uniref:DUF3558 family protein n=1 Tax=Actinopolyspora alba TaxID=673379 RepID=UPI000B804D33|nr:DUF3558 family protein [Actinopolyspora alba]
MATVAGVVLLGVTGCSPGGLADDSSETTGAKPSDEVLAGVDPCGLLSDEELKSFGLETQGGTRNELPWAPGCYYAGEPVSARLEKNTRQTVASSEKRSTWARFDRTQVNGRDAASAIPKGATKARACVLMFDAGQGLIQIQTREIRLPDDVDECAKALEIAKKVEPNVPEPA